MNANKTIRPADLSGFQYLVLGAAIFTFLLIVIGNIVRVSGSALGCPDWPTCYGQWSLPGTLSAQIQYAHRAIALLASLATLAAAAWAAVRYHWLRWASYPLYGAAVLMAVEVLLGAESVLTRSPAQNSWLHLGLALAALALVLVSTVTLFYRRAGYNATRLRFRTPYARLTLAGLAATFIVLVSGAYVVNSGAAIACTGWPLCNGHLLPGNTFEWAQMIHRLLSLAASGVALVLFLGALRSQRSQQAVLTAATSFGILFFSQVLVGAWKVSRGFPMDLVGLHAATAAGVWAAMVVLAVAVGLTGRSAEEESAEAHQKIFWRQRARDLFALTKPVIVLLLLVTTYAGMVVGGKGLPSLALTLWTMLGGALAAGGASAINQYIDRDIDGAMQRTAKRPLPGGRMYPAEGLAFGVALCFLAFYLLAGTVNMLAALLSLAGMIYYVLVYTILLKRVTVQNIVIGGGAGAIPPMVGWAAASGHLNIPALFLFAIIFLWTPPHFWALALVRRKDYARAGVPMLPVVKGEKATRQQIFIYTLELVGLTLVMPAFKMAGSVYLVSAAVLGGGFIYQAWRVWRDGGNKSAWMLYRYSSMYLALLFAALVVDVFIK
jgi:protoheme IX farnesyltransferase